jgi:hypothetical protein
MTPNRKQDRFRAKYSDTLTILETELRHLAASAIVIQIALHERDIRLDGLPRSDARQPAHPGIILSFQSKHGPLSYPCDTFTDWQANLRGIALSLEHLRTVDRYGVTRRGEQYRGWQQLPPPAGVQAMAPTMTRAEAAAVLVRLAATGTVALILRDPEITKSIYRDAVLRCHPDRGGNAQDFKLVQEAKAALDQAT